jgi:predicted nucleic acid-binding protein
MKVLLDTNVYITALRSKADREYFRTAFFPLLPATVLSAVVVYELSVSASDVQTRDLLGEFIAPMERAGRVVTPTFEDWQAAAGVVSAIGRKDAAWKSKLPALLDDVLIALCARRVGARLVTYNGSDFRLIRRHLNFGLDVLEQRAGRSGSSRLDEPR